MRDNSSQCWGSSCQVATLSTLAKGNRMTAHIQRQVDPVRASRTVLVAFPQLPDPPIDKNRSATLTPASVSVKLTASRRCYQHTASKPYLRKQARTAVNSSVDAAHGRATRNRFAPRTQRARAPPWGTQGSGCATNPRH